MMGRKFGMDVQNLVKEKSSNHIVLKSRSFSFDNKSKAPPHITRRQSICAEKPPLLNVSKPASVAPAILDLEPSQKIDLQFVPDYYQQCVKHMMSLEKSNKSQAEMEHKNPKFSRKRADIVEWMINIHEQMKLFPETLFIAISYMDQFACKTEIESAEEQILPLACILMAGKFEETYRIPSIRHLLKFLEAPLEKRRIIEMEQKIIEVLDFKLIKEVPLRYLELFSKLINLSNKNRFIAQYIIELSLLETSFIQFSPSMLACSAVYLVSKIRKLSPSWPHVLQELTGYDESQLRHCAKQMCSLLERSPELKHGGGIRRKFSRSEYFEASKIRLQRKNQ